MRRDLVHAVRIICKNPLFAATTVLTLALAIGGNTALFTVVHAVLLKPLDYSGPEELVRMIGGATPTRLVEMKAGAHSFTGLGAFTAEENLTLSSQAEPELLPTVWVSANFLDILGVAPLAGRSFLPQEDAPGSAPVAMISAELWQRRFAGDRSVIGRTIALGAAPVTIVGVLPERFQFPFPGLDVWETRPSEWPMMPEKSRALSPFLTVFGRIRPGVSLTQANAEMSLLQRRYAAAHPAMLDAKTKSPLELTRLKDQMVASVRAMLWMLFGAVGFVLAIACANIASLLLARSASRSREFAIRSALGASRFRLVSQLLVESLLLSVAGGTLGVLLAAWAVRAIPAITTIHLPRSAEIHLDSPVLAFAAALSIATGILFGLAPSLVASRPDLAAMLRSRGEAASQSFRGRVLAWFSVRSLLVVAQVALSVTLLIGAALLVESFVHLRRANLGFNSANLLTFRVSLPLSRYDTDQKQTAFFAECVRRARGIPGVRDATAAMFLPMTGYVGSPVQDAGKPLLKLNERVIATIMPVATDYFRTLGIPLRRGRDFDEHDTDTAPRVAIIDEAFARRFWPGYPAGQNPVGQRLLIGGVSAQAAQVIGIAASVHQNLENTSWPEGLYVSLAQNGQPSAMLAVRTEGAPGQFTNAMREQVRAIDRDQPISAVRSMDDLVDDQIGQRRLTVSLLSSFAAVALLLALLGIYGVIAYLVVQRTHEIGVRRALGAPHANIVRLVVGQAFGMALAGVALGVAGAWALTRVMIHLLFEVSPTDPSTFIAIAVLFIAVALAASFIPAQRATRIDPMSALQTEL